MDQETRAKTQNLIEIPARDAGIILRQFSLADAPHLFALINRNRPHLSQFGDITAEKYKTLESVERSITNPLNYDRLRFGIWNNNGELVGSINLTPDENYSKRAEIGCYLGSEYTGKGYALNATLALCNWAFNNRKIDEVYAKVDTENPNSPKVLLKAVFIETGIEEAKNGRKNRIFTLVKPK